MNQLLYQKIKSVVFLMFTASILFIGCQTNMPSDREKNEEKNKAVDSLEIVTRLIQQDSSNFKLFATRSKLYLKRGQIDPAFRDLSYAIDINPNDPGLFILLGDLYFIIGKKDNCLSSYRKAGELDPKSLSPVLKLAETHLILQEYEPALQFIQIALNLDINSSKAYYLKGIYNMETGDTSNALLNLQIAGNLDSTYYEAFMQAGTLYNSLKDSTAIVFYQAALKAIPDEERAMLLLGESYQTNGNFEDAIDVYQKINELYPANKTAYYNLAYINMVELRDFDAAKESFRQAILIDPTYVEAVYNLGRIYEEIGEFDLARNQYKQALELKTNYPLAIDGLNRLDHIQVAN